MARIVGEVEEIFHNSFQWSIPDFFALSSAGQYTAYKSPDFKCRDATWFMTIWPHGWYPGVNFGWISLFVFKPVFTKYDFMSCTVGIIDLNGKVYISRECDKEDSNEREVWVNKKIIQLSDVLNGRDQLAPKNVLTVFCTLSLKQKTGLALQSINEEISVDKATKEKTNPKKEAKEQKGEVICIPKGIDNLTQNLKTLFLDEKDCDVTLKVKDQDFRAHTLILGARSPVFCSMFKHDTVERKSGVVNIIDCESDIFQDFLLYLYTGKVEEMSTSVALGLYSAADKYGLDDLKKECVEFMEKELSVDIFGDVIALAVLHKEASLIETATAFFAKNMQEIIVTLKWQSFLIENPFSANELYIKALKILLPK